jgi:bifunctional DNA-binding transcriptional regulator/antitoxin component of YhaV-PrlF toxin-antitoxin module
MKLEEVYDIFRKNWYIQPNDSVEIKNNKLQKILILEKLNSNSFRKILDEYLKLRK